MLKEASIILPTMSCHHLRSNCLFDLTTHGPLYQPAYWFVMESWFSFPTNILSILFVVMKDIPMHGCFLVSINQTTDISLTDSASQQKSTMYDVITTSCYEHRIAAYALTS